MKPFADGGHAEASLFEPLVSEDEAAIVPGEHLGLVATLRDEDEEVTRVEALFPLIADDGAQPVDAVAHVHRLRREENPDGSREQKHSLPER